MNTHTYTNEHSYIEHTNTKTQIHAYIYSHTNTPEVHIFSRLSFMWQLDLTKNGHNLYFVLYSVEKTCLPTEFLVEFYSHNNLWLHISILS